MLIKESKTNVKYLLIVAVLAIVAGGITYWQYLEIQKEEFGREIFIPGKKETPKQEIREEELSADFKIIGIDEETGWNIGRSENYGFEIKYPKGEGCGWPSMPDRFLCQKDITDGKRNFIFDIGIGVPHAFGERMETDCPSVPKISDSGAAEFRLEEVMIGNLKFCKGSILYAVSTAEDLGMSYHYFIKRNSKYLDFSFSFNILPCYNCQEGYRGNFTEEDNVKVSQFFNQILSTFRFLD